MSLTLPELKQRLADKYDPESLLETLGLNTTEALVEVLNDYIEENYDKLVLEVDDDFSPYQEET
jgi:hypothetical protein